MIGHLDTLAAVVLAGSLAMERLVTVVKTVAPGMFGEPSPTPGGPQTIFAGTPRGRLVPRTREQGRRLLVLAVVFAASFLTAWFLSSKGACPPPGGGQCRVVQYGSDTIPWWVYAILISGGSAMWANLVGYFSALKDVTAEQRRTVADQKANVIVVNTGEAARAEMVHSDSASLAARQRCQNG